MDQPKIISSIDRLRTYVESNDFKGYDPYDALNAAVPFLSLGKWPGVIAIQVMKRNPVNIRPMIGIKKGRNPKAIGLFLSAYSRLHELSKDAKQSSVMDDVMDELYDWLITHAHPGYKGLSWGYNFDWASPVKTVKVNEPNLVATAFIAKGMFDYYRSTGKKDIPGNLQRICQFIEEELPRSVDDSGTCLSYTTNKKDRCYNASLLGAEVLAMNYKMNGNKAHKDLAIECLRFVMSRQKQDGRWNYSEDIETGSERAQIDFHQGYLLESARHIMELTDHWTEEYIDGLIRGLAFYRNELFTEEGRALWRFPKQWPTDIHCLSQGIITFTDMDALVPGSREFAYKIAGWSIKAMQDKKGYFYFRKYQSHTNKIPYMRWGQAWMMLALTRLLKNG